MILRQEKKFRIRNPLEMELFATNTILILPENPQRCSDWKIPTWLGMSSEGLAILTEGARRAKHEGTLISWRFAAMVYPTAVCFVASGEQIRGKPVDGSQAPMSQHRRLHLSRCISGQQTRRHCPIMLRVRIRGFSILYHTAD